MEIVLKIVISGLNEDNSNGLNLREKLRNFAKSVVIHAQKYPIRFIFITDHRSVFQIEKTFADLLPPFELENQLANGMTVARFSFEYIYVEPLLAGIEPKTQTMKKYFNHGKEKFVFTKSGQSFVQEYSAKYNDTIYYLSPFYHQIFPQLKKLIIMDTDMEFLVDPALLHHQFEQFGMDQILGSANDLAPHYHSILENAGYEIKLKMS